MRVYTQGSYDIFHAGHVNFLRRCAKFGEVTVALLTDRSFLEYRGHPPINKYEDRKAVLEACEYVDNVRQVSHKLTGLDFKELKPDIIAIGTDWAVKDIYKQWGVSPGDIDERLIYIPYTKGISSTEIKRRIYEINQV